MSNDLHLPQANTSVKALPPLRVEQVGEPLDMALFEASCPDTSPVVQGIYAHIPFCQHRCHYCDFFTTAQRDELRGPFVDRFLNELAAAPDWVWPRVETIFVGGGTPTYLEAPDLERLLSGLRSRVGQGVDLEFSVEANPETVTPEIAAALADGGVNRVSLGAQSFDRSLLASLDRQHDPDTVARALELIHDAGIERTSLDLIFGIPGEDLTRWERDVAQAISLGPGHLSCYGLIYEPGTPLRGRLDRGEIDAVDEDLEASMYEQTLALLAEAGFQHYEISNWARPGEVCRHNLLYWHNRNWWALGPSASGHVEGWRWRNLPRLSPYIEGQGLSRVRDLEQLDEDGRVGERFMMGLRCIEGIDRVDVEQLLAGDGGDRRGPIMEEHIRQGLLRWRQDRLQLTRRGLLLANLVTADLLGPATPGAMREAHPAP